MRLRAPGYLLFVLLAFLFSVNAGGAFPSFVFYLAGGVAVLSWLWARWLARGLAVTVEAQGKAFRVGDRVEIVLRIENESPVPVPWLVLRDDTGAPPGRGRRLGMAMLPYSERRLHRTVAFQRRGRYRAGPVEVRCGDPVGLFEIRRQIEGNERFVVYPRPLQIDHLPLRFRQPFGRVPTRLRAHQDPSSIADLRPLAPGDSPRFIHWKASAKRGELHVREFELRATTSLLVILDMQRAVHAGSGTRSTDETAASLALGIAAYALRHDLAVGLLASGSRRLLVPPGRGPRHFHLLRERVVDVQADGIVPLARWAARQRPVVEPGSSLVFITPRLDRPLVSLLTRLRRAGYDVILVHLLPETFDPTERPEPLRDRLWEVLRAGGVTLVRAGADGQGLDALRRVAARASLR